jgi:hypothetical protein
MTALVRQERRLEELAPAEALALLAGTGFGRIVFTARALPAIRPVNHLVADGRIVLRTHLDGAVAAAVAGAGAVVAYEADQIDAERRLGWSVVATGFARVVTDPADLARFHADLVPWVDLNMDLTISIEPELITGFRLVPAR